MHLENHYFSETDTPLLAILSLLISPVILLRRGSSKQTVSAPASPARASSVIPSTALVGFSLEEHPTGTAYDRS